MKIEWRRYNHWAAHLFIDGVQACATPHGQFWNAGPCEPATLTSAELSRHGIPFGKVCQRCMKSWNKPKRKTA